MRPNARHLFGLIALAVLAALLVLLLFRPQVAAPTAERDSAPAEASPDGRRWTPVGPRQPLGSGVAIGLAIRDRQVLAVAEHFDGNRSETRIWLGSAS
ncbi:MAG: hypothetical protein ACRDFY_03150 [Candidatus Limnocylindria bacterium]